MFQFTMAQVVTLLAALSFHDTDYKATYDRLYGIFKKAYDDLKAVGISYPDARAIFSLSPFELVFTFWMLSDYAVASAGSPSLRKKITGIQLEMVKAVHKMEAVCESADRIEVLVDDIFKRMSN